MYNCLVRILQNISHVSIVKLILPLISRTHKKMNPYRADHVCLPVRFSSRTAWRIFMKFGMDIMLFKATIYTLELLQCELARWERHKCHVISVSSEQQPSLEDSDRLHLVFTSLDIAIIIFLQNKVVSLASNPQRRRLGPCIHVPHWQGSPVIPPGTGFPFRRLLRLAGLRWRFYNRLPHGECHLI
jgi:hypothetical protein